MRSQAARPRCLYEDACLPAILRAFKLRDLGKAFMLQRSTHQLQHLAPVDLPGSIPNVLAEELGEGASQRDAGHYRLQSGTAIGSVVTSKAITM